MTIKSEFKEIFIKWNSKAPYDILYNTILKWLSKYKNIVKSQNNITDILNRIYEYDMNQLSDDTFIYVSNPRLKKDLIILIEDVIFGDVYQPLRDELRS